MKNIIHDIGKCIYVGFLIGVGVAVVVALFALLLRSNIPESIGRFEIYAGCIGMSIAAMAFIRPKTLRPLDYQEEWKRYFRSFNIGIAILGVGLTLLILGVIILDIIGY